MCQICSEFNPFQPDFLHPEPAIHADAPADTSTTTTLTVGRSLSGHLGAGDEDWIKLDVKKGDTLTISTSEGIGDAVSDPMLILYDRNGNEVDRDDDDGQGFHASLDFVAQAGTYYVAVTHHLTDDGKPTTDEGTYRLSLSYEGTTNGGGTDPSKGLPTLSNDEIAEKLVHEYWEDSGRSARGFDVDVSGGKTGVIYVDTSALADAGAWFADQALQAWSDVTGLTFSETTPPAGTPVGIRFDDENSGAYASTTLYSNGSTANVFINISSGWISGDHYDTNSYAMQTYMHEIGHALGLGHAGAYNVGEGLSVNYEDHAEFANDSWQATLMSYFSQEENAESPGSRAYLLTPMVADILSMRELYGKAGDLRADDTVYGHGSTAGGHYDNLAKLGGKMAFTLLDDGGVDRLDLSNSLVSQRLDMRPEAYSDIDGLIGNMAIARGTWIENVATGSGDDQIVANRRKNDVTAGSGDDWVEGRGGHDALHGQDGSDRLYGGGGKDKLYGGDGSDRLEGGNGKDHLFGGAGIDRLYGDGGRDFLTGGAGKDVFVFAPGQGRDRVLDFEIGTDRLDLRAFDLDGPAEAMSAMRQAGKSLVIQLDDVEISLKKIDIDDISADDLIL